MLKKICVCLSSLFLISCRPITQDSLLSFSKSFENLIAETSVKTREILGLQKFRYESIYMENVPLAQDKEPEEFENKIIEEVQNIDEDKIRKIEEEMEVDEEEDWKKNLYDKYNSLSDEEKNDKNKLVSVMSDELANMPPEQQVQAIQEARKYIDFRN